MIFRAEPRAVRLKRYQRRETSEHAGLERCDGVVADVSLGTDVVPSAVSCVHSHCSRYINDWRPENAPDLMDTIPFEARLLDGCKCQTTCRG